MGDLGWPRSTRTPDARHAVELLRDVLLEAADARERASPWSPLAPMTNVALLLRTYPEVVCAACGGSSSWAAPPHVGNATALGGVQRLPRPGGRRESPTTRAPDLGLEARCPASTSSTAPGSPRRSPRRWWPTPRRRPGRARRASWSPSSATATSGRLGHVRRRWRGVRGASTPTASRLQTAAGARRARRHLVARPHDRRPPRWAGRPGPRLRRRLRGAGREASTWRCGARRSPADGWSRCSWPVARPAALNRRRERLRPAGRGSRSASTISATPAPASISTSTHSAAHAQHPRRRGREQHRAHQPRRRAARHRSA